MEPSPDFATLKELAVLDRRRRELIAEQGTLTADISRREAALVAQREFYAKAHARYDEETKEKRLLEGMVADKNQLLVKYRGQLDVVKTNKEYQSLQHEIEETQRQIAGAEDRLLEVMDELDRLHTEDRAGKEKLAAVQSEAQTATACDQERLRDAEVQLLEVEAKRQRLVPALTPQVRGEYLRIFEHYHGDPFAAAEEGHCAGCYVNVPAQILSELRAGRKLYRCESCGRFIIFVSEEWRP